MRQRMTERGNDMLKLFIKTHNAAFDEAPATELARILRDLAARIETDGPPDYASLFDAEGLRTGQVEFDKEQ